MTSYVFPRSCCRCMGDADCATSITTSQHMGTYQIVQSVDVPVCSGCKRWVEGIPIAVWIVTGLIITAISASGVGWNPGPPGLLVKILAGAFIGGSLGALPAYYASRLSAPARLSSGGHLEFDNEEYQKIFVEANGKPKI